MRAAYLMLFALLAGSAVFVAATGLLGTTLALAAGTLGFSQGTTGVIMAVYFVGFVLGTFVCPRIIGEVGYIRAFSVFAAVAAACALLHALSFSAFTWAVLRLVTGGCVVGLYMVIESWLNEKSTDQSRGRILAGYQVVSLLGLAVGQWLLLIDASGATPFLVCGTLFALGLVPVALTRVPEPSPISPVALDIGYLWRSSPLGTFGILITALANGVFFALGPVFAQSAGFDLQQVVLFMSLVILGGVSLQWPIGHLSDLFDRRTVILLTSLGAALLAGLCALAIERSIVLFFVSSFFYGGLTFSLYPLCIAHSNDRVPPEEFVRTASGLLLVYGIGASIGPAVLGFLMARFGQTAFFTVLLFTHATLSAYAVFRMGARAAPGIDRQEPFVMLSRTSQSVLGMVSDAHRSPPN